MTKVEFRFPTTTLFLPMQEPILLLWSYHITARKRMYA